MDLTLVSTLVSLGLASGINLYATVLIAGLSIRLGWVQHVPAGLDVLATWPVLAVAGTIYAVEFLADKIQFVDTLWDSIHTFVRPLGAAVLALEAVAPLDPKAKIVAMLLTGAIALTAHAGKATSRATLNVISPAENISNIGVSVAEDVGAAGLTWLALQHPLVAAVIALMILLVIVVLLPRLVRRLWRTGQGIARWFRGGTPKAGG